MKNKEKISVVIPTYNREKLIVQSINSVLEQTYENIEVIVVDDASTDNTKEVVKKIKDKRVKYIGLKQNKGACNARNVGIENATGDYIAFQDSDDIFRPEKIEKQYSNLIQNKSDMDFCKICINDKDIKIEVPTLEQEESIINNKILDELCNGNFISTQAVLIKKNVIKRYMFDTKLPRLQDFDIVMRMAPEIKISYTKEVLVDLYRQNDSISNSYEKLKNAITFILNKNYKLNLEQKEKLNFALINLISNNIELILNRRYDDLMVEYDELNKKHKELYSEYNNIINSKRWQITDKIFRFLKK